MALFRHDSAMITLMQGVTQALAKGDANDARQQRHENECGERYKETARAIEKLSDKMDQTSEKVATQTKEAADLLARQAARYNKLIMSVGGSLIAGLAYLILHAKGWL